MDKGWNIKYKKGRKSLCTVYIRRGWFTCLVTAPASILPELEARLFAFAPEFQNLYEQTSLFNGGKWLCMEVRERAQLETVWQLVLLKAGPGREDAVRKDTH